MCEQVDIAWSDTQPAPERWRMAALLLLGEYGEESMHNTRWEQIRQAQPEAVLARLSRYHQTAHILRSPGAATALCGRLMRGASLIEAPAASQRICDQCSQRIVDATQP